MHRTVVPKLLESFSASVTSKLRHQAQVAPTHTHSPGWLVRVPMAPRSLQRCGGQGGRASEVETDRWSEQISCVCIQAGAGFTSLGTLDRLGLSYYLHHLAPIGKQLRSMNTMCQKSPLLIIIVHCSWFWALPKCIYRPRELSRQAIWNCVGEKGRGCVLGQVVIFDLIADRLIVEQV